jgi:hypothetical protein
MTAARSSADVTFLDVHIASLVLAEAQVLKNIDGRR